MKKIAISLLALAAVSTAAFAGDNRGYDLRDSDTYFGKYSNQVQNEHITSANAFAVVNDEPGSDQLRALEEDVRRERPRRQSLIAQSA